MSVTKEAMEDQAKGIFSFEPLRSRLADSDFEQEGSLKLRDLASPIIKLTPLNPGEMYVLLEKLAELHGVLYDYTPTLEHDDYIYFLKQQYGKNATVREMIQRYITFLNMIQQNSLCHEGTVIHRRV